MRISVFLFALVCGELSWAATPLTPDTHTVILDHFNKSTIGTAFGNPSFSTGPSGLGDAIDLTAGTHVQYSLPTTLEAAGTIEMWVRVLQYGALIMNFNWNNTTSYPPAGHVLHLQLTAGLGTRPTCTL
jgi:hypothetical protein